MNQSIHPARHIMGEIDMPGDKSISHRAIIMGSLAQGTSVVEGLLLGDDCLNTIDCFRKLGVPIDILSSSKVIVKGNGLFGLKEVINPLDAGNSGTTSRILMGVLAGQPFSTTLTGDESLCRRPMDRIVDPLTRMGAVIRSQGNRPFLPLHIIGHPLHGISYTMPIASAQVKSSLMMAALYANSPVTITEPYGSRNHTELMLEVFGVKTNIDHNTITVNPAYHLDPCDLFVPGDISSAAYFITAALIIPNSQICLRNIGLNPTRTGILDVYRSMGAKIEITNRRVLNLEPVGDITVSSSDLKGTIIEGPIIPRLIDEIPIIAVAAAFAQGKTIIKNAGELKIKESNRIDRVVEQLSKFGVRIIGTDDGMIINGGKELFGTVIDSCKDHRIAMAMSIAALAAQGESTIRGAECVNISFPGFYHLLSKVSAS